METIREYLENAGTSPRVASKILAKLEKNSDIADELKRAIKDDAIPTNDGISAEGYTASMIYDRAPFMNLVAVYSFLIDLRDNPTEAKEIIANGFPRK